MELIKLNVPGDQLHLGPPAAKTVNKNNFQNSSPLWTRTSCTKALETPKHQVKLTGCPSFPGAPGWPGCTSGPRGPSSGPLPEGPGGPGSPGSPFCPGDSCRGRILETQKENNSHKNKTFNPSSCHGYCVCSYFLVLKNGGLKS